MKKLIVELSPSPRTEISTDRVTIRHSGGAAEYNGTYTVTPAPEAQILATAGRSMTGSVTVQRVPYREETNNTGGITVVTGG